MVSQLISQCVDIRVNSQLLRTGILRATGGELGGCIRGAFSVTDWSALSSTDLVVHASVPSLRQSLAQLTAPALDSISLPVASFVSYPYT